MGKCITCCEEMKDGAMKCIHCDSFQDYRRHLRFSSTVLALLVALISVLTFAIPAIKSVITPKNSNIKFTFQGFGEKSIVYIVSNKGIRPGGVGDVFFIYSISNENPKRLKMYGDKSFVKAGDAIQIMLNINSEYRAKITKNDIKTKESNLICKIELNSIEFDGTTTQKLYKIKNEACKNFLERIAG